jgi:lipid II:glycine glycyltransferase (peptidoglycan interpeptide bridge formation enzyme)
LYGHANRLAIREMIKSAKKEGLAEFDFGGYATGKIGEELKGINEFKLSFGGRICEKFSYSKNYSIHSDLTYC